MTILCQKGKAAVNNLLYVNNLEGMQLRQANGSVCTLVGAKEIDFAIANSVKKAQEEPNKDAVIM